MTTTTSVARACLCPMCSTPWSDTVLRIILTETGRVDPVSIDRYVEYHATAVASAQETNPRATSMDPSLERSFIRWARENHIKRCGECNAPIEKNGGCQHMRCGSCQHSFNWGAAPLLHPCCGYHYTRKFPFLERCKHLPARDFKIVHRASYYAQLAPLAVAVSPVALIALPVLGLAEVKDRYQDYIIEWRQAKRRAANLAAAAHEYAAEMEEMRQQMTACRQTGEHEWVAGWCHRCGALEESAANASKGAAAV